MNSIYVFIFFQVVLKLLLSKKNESIKNLDQVAGIVSFPEGKKFVAKVAIWNQLNVLL